MSSLPPLALATSSSAPRPRRPAPPPLGRAVGDARAARAGLAADEPPTEICARPAVAAVPLFLPAVRPATAPLRPPYTVESIFLDFTYRRVALINALTRDEEEFVRRCEDPGLPSELYLYGHIDGTWEVKPSELLIPLGRPEPSHGINLTGDKLKRMEWLKHIAMHCDAWLIHISFFLGLYLKANQRQRLFSMMNSVPTVHETFVASDTYLRICHLEQKRSSGSVEENNETDEEVVEEMVVEEVVGKEVVEEEVVGVVEEEVVEEDDDDVTSEEEEEENFCGSCGDRYHANGFWICCDVCDLWFHGKCVKVKNDQVEGIKHYQCPECRCEKTGHDYDEDPILSNLFKRS